MGTRDNGRNSPFGGQRLIPVKNDESTAIPMGGICWLNGSTTIGDSDMAVYSAKQADGNDHPWFVAITAIGPGKRGVVSRDWPAHAAYDASVATPAVDDEIGPISGNWRLRPTGTGFIAFTAGVDGWVDVIGTGSTTTSPTTWAEIEFEVQADFDYGDTPISGKIKAIRGDTTVGAVDDIVSINNPTGSVNATWFYGCTNMRGWATWDPDAEEWNAKGLECDPDCTPA